MTTVSAVLIVRNEALVLARCLAAVKDHVDELIVADTGSTDNTVAVAQAMGAKVVHFAWIDDFSAARNFAFAQATTDWSFWLDADDIAINPERIRPLVANAPADVGGYQWRYINGRNNDGTPAFSYWRERCVRNDSGRRWQGRIHEVMLIDERLRLVRSDEVSVEHQPPAGREKDPGRNLRILEDEFNLAKGAPGARTLFYLGREYADNGQTDKAIEILTRSGREDPWADQRYLALTQVGALQTSKGNYDEAIDVYLESLKTHPTWPDAYFGLAQCYYYRQDWPKVIHWIEIARSCPIPDTPLFRDERQLKIEWLIFYTNALHHVGRAEAAREWTRLALKLDPKNQWHQANAVFFAESPNLMPAPTEVGPCLSDDGQPGPC